MPRVCLVAPATTVRLALLLASVYRLLRRSHERLARGCDRVQSPLLRAGVYLHGTKADLAVGHLLVPGRESNFEAGRVMNYVYFTATLDAAVWGAELAGGDGRGRIYFVEPTGEFKDDPNVTD